MEWWWLAECTQRGRRFGSPTQNQMMGLGFDEQCAGEDFISTGDDALEQGLVECDGGGDGW